MAPLTTGRPPSMAWMLLLSLLCTAAVADRAAGQDIEPSPQQDQEGPPTPPPAIAENRALVLIVTVVGVLQETAESPVTGATVTVFAADHKEARPTDATGKATFKFSSTATTMTLRVVADEWLPHQQQLEIDSAEKAQKVSLRAPD
jgi:hypothetical protein